MKWVWVLFLTLGSWGWGMSGPDPRLICELVGNSQAELGERCRLLVKDRLFSSDAVSLCLLVEKNELAVECLRVSALKIYREEEIEECSRTWGPPHGENLVACLKRLGTSACEMKSQ